jgi:signal transduction histidine kinase
VLVALLVASTLCAVFFFSRDAPWAIPLWWALLNGISAARYALIRRFRAARPGPEAAPRWARLAVASTLATGAVWGLFAVALGPAWGSAGYPLAVFLVAGIPAVGLIANAALLPAYVALQVPILLPVAAKLIFFEGGGVDAVSAGAAALLYSVVLAGIGRVVNRGITENFELRFRNEGLLERLSTANRELQLEIHRREDADRAKSRFLAKVSHEIRTPINGVLGMNELLLHSFLSTAQRRQAEGIGESARWLLRIMNDILDLSRAGTAGLGLNPGEFEVREAVTAAVELVRERAEKGGLSLSLSVDERVPDRARGDAARLRQVLVNLVDNAVKFTPHGGVTVAVNVSPASSPDACRLRFEVRDSGIGIAAAEQERLFQPFVQLDDGASRRYEGVGLGLAISREIVERMGGRIGVESALGQGSRFWFEVSFERPQARDHDGPWVATPSHTQAAS